MLQSKEVRTEGGGLAELTPTRSRHARASSPIQGEGKERIRFVFSSPGKEEVDPQEQSEGGSGGGHLNPSSPTNSIFLGAPDRVLRGGLALSELHEIVPAAPPHAGAALGFALALALTAPLRGGTIVFVQQDFAALEAGALYGLGCDHFGLAPTRLLVVRAATPRDALWAMEEALKTRGLTAIIGELAQHGEAADLTATRRLSLAAQKGGALALLLRQYAFGEPSAAATRWQVAAAPGAGDGFGGLGRTGFSLALTKNRRGPCGNWILQWDHHGACFIPAVSRAVAAPVFDRFGDAAVASLG
jgi:protein ImuA